MWLVDVLRADHVTTNVHDIRNCDIREDLRHVQPVVERSDVAVIAEVIGELWAKSVSIPGDRIRVTTIFQVSDSISR